MDAEISWQEFACTGNIFRYLDYKQALDPETSVSVGELTDGHDCDDGSCSQGNTL